MTGARLRTTTSRRSRPASPTVPSRAFRLEFPAALPPAPPALGASVSAAHQPPSRWRRSTRRPGRNQPPSRWRRPTRRPGRGPAFSQLPRSPPLPASRPRRTRASACARTPSSWLCCASWRRVIPGKEKAALSYHTTAQCRPNGAPLESLKACGLDVPITVGASTSVRLRMPGWSSSRLGTRAPSRRIAAPSWST